MTLRSKRMEGDDGSVSYPSAWGLSNPSEVEIDGREHSEAYRLPMFKRQQPSVSQPTLELDEIPELLKPAKPISAAKIMRAVKDLAALVPADSLIAVLPHLTTIHETIQLVGGHEEFEELLSLV